MRKVILIIALLAFPLVCFGQDATTKTTPKNEEQLNLPPEAEVFDWTKITPLDFLDVLKSRSGTLVTIWVYPPKDWIKKEHINQLCELVDSDKPAAPVVSVISSYRPQPQSTVGNEAMFLIEGFRKGHYPPDLCSVHYFKGNPEEFRKWCKEQIK